MQTIAAQAKEGQELAAMELLLTELERIRRFGFTDAEIERARGAIRLNMEQYVAQKDTTDSETLIDEHVRVFLEGEPMPGVLYEASLTKKYLPTITSAEINAWVHKGFFTGRSRILSVDMPEKVGLPVPTDAEILALVSKVADANVAPPLVEGAVLPLLSALPTPGTVADEGRDDALGTVTWTIGNGVRVIVKQTDFNADQVVFQAFAAGGTSVVDDTKFASATLAPDILARSGLGEHDPISLARALAGKDVGVEGFISNEFDGLVGGAREADLEAMFQLIWLHVAAPRFDSSAADLVRLERMEELRNRSNSPEASFWDTWSQMVWSGHPRYSNWKVEEIQSVSAGAAKAVWSDHFGDLGGFTFVFSGSASPDELRPLVARYLASLPGTPRTRAWKDDGVRKPTGVVSQQIQAADLPRAHVMLAFHGPFDSNPASRNVLDGVSEVLGSVLRGELREDRGGTYGVGVSADTDEWPVPTYSLTVEFECDPARVDELVDAMWRMIDRVRAFTPSKEGIAVMREQRIRDRESESAENAFWVRAISTALQRGEDPRTILGWNKLQEAITGDDLRVMANRVLQRDQFVLLVQRP
jgi:zinc protease